MRIVQLAAVVLGIAFLPQAGMAAGGGGGGGSDFGSMPRQTPEDIARSEYSDGVRGVKQADKYAQQASEETKDDKKAKANQRAQSSYEKARQHFLVAVKQKPKMHEAWNYIGYTSRKLGDYSNALAAYEEALRIKPDYSEAIEYRGEAYLGLNRLDDAKGAYMTLFKNARPLADMLMAAMQKWVTDRRIDAAGVSTSDIDTFAQWITERTTIAQQTASLAVDAPVGPSWN